MTRFARWPKFFDITPSYMRVPIAAAMLDGTQRDTGIAIPRNGRITDVLVFVRTPEATATDKTIKVGYVGADEAGFINGLDVGPGQDGWQSPSAADGTTGVYMTEAQGGVNLPIPTINAGDDAYNVSVTSAEAFHEFDADVWLRFESLPDYAGIVR